MIHNRFLIHQGEVESIAMIKPKAEAKGEIGLLEHLEDLIGSNIFAKDIEDMMLKITDLQDQNDSK